MGFEACDTPGPMKAQSTFFFPFLGLRPNHFLGPINLSVRVLLPFFRLFFNRLDRTAVSSCIAAISSVRRILKSVGSVKAIRCMMYRHVSAWLYD